MTRVQLNEYYNEYYNTKLKDAVLSNQLNVSNKKSKFNVLFLDEFSRAQTDLHNACLQLVLEKRLHNHILPFVNGKQTQVIAGDNPADEDYHVNTLDPATRDRFLYLQVEVDPEGWIAWARENKVNKIVRDYIIDNQTKLHFEDATPRSWTKLASFVDGFEDVPEDLHLQIIRGKIGEALGSQFYLFYNDYSNNISIVDIEKFIKKTNKSTKDIVETGALLKDYLEDMENITKMENLTTLFNRDRFRFETGKMEDVLSIFGLLHSFEIETLTSFLKDKKANDKKAFYDLMKLDLDRVLAMKIKSKVVK